MLIEGHPAARGLLFAGESEQEAIATWRRHTKSQIPQSLLSAVPTVRSGEGAETTGQAPSNVVLVSAAGFTNRTVLSQFGVADYVPKPLDTQALLKAISRAACG